MIAMAVLVDNRIYETEFAENETIEVGSNKFANLVIPELEQKWTIRWRRDAAEISIEENLPIGKKSKSGDIRTITAPLGNSTTVDFNRKIAVAFSQASQSDQHVYFDSNCSIKLGRSVKKKADGSENDILVTLPFVSGRHMEFVSQNGKLYLRDSGSTNGTFVNGNKVMTAEIKPGDVISVLTFRMVYDGNRLSFFNAEDALTIRVKTGRTEQTNGTNPAVSPVIFERSMRLREHIDPETVLLPSAPAIGEKPKIDYLSTFLPAMVTVAIGIVMFIMGNVSSLMYSLPMTLSGVIVSLLNYRRQTKEYSSAAAAAEEKFKSEVMDAEAKLEDFNARQLAVMNAESPETPRMIHAAESRSILLWNRRASDDDFMNVRLGIGKVPTLADIHLSSNSGTAGSEHHHRCIGVKEKYSQIDHAPVCTNIRRNHITGIVGNRTDTGKFLENMMVQLSAAYCYTELRIIFLGSDHRLRWVEKLPHTAGSFASNKQEADKILDSVIPVLKEREKAVTARNSYAKQMFLPYILFVAADPSLLPKNSDTDQYILAGEQLNVGIVLAAEGLEQLPISSGAVIRINGSDGELIITQNASSVIRFTAEQNEAGSIVRFASAMENIRVREEAKTEGGEAGPSVPTKYSFYEMLGIRSAAELNLKKRWAENDSTRALKAPIGIGEKGSVMLDISGKDTADGPHGLVAGTTGSGKSEAIVSYLLALATLYGPTDLSLVIIDFKGGAMCSKFRDLPHLVGCITNLADKEISRSLKTIDAELKHRQHLLQEASDAVETHDVDSIDKYIKLYKRGCVREPMPHLVIVVDEFAELKAQYPQFLDKLVSAARIGRSLGVHLILATQKPSGQVSDQIWSNSKFRICLKVQTEQDSKEVIKNDKAAGLKDAGRAYLMVGNNERFELFQSGYSGFPDMSAVSRRGSGDALTQFNAVLNQIVEYCRRERIAGLPAMFMEPLPEQAKYPAVLTPGDSAGTVPIGIYDDPAGKLQSEYSIPLAESNVMIIGSSQMGKTNILQSVIRGLANRYTPDEVSVYILDFASQLLRKYEGLNHVGGVITSTDDEKLKHFMQLLESEFAARREKFSKAGVSSLAAYREQGGTDVPHIVVIIDNLTGLKELYFQEDDELVRLCRDGLSVGVSVVAANSATKGIGYKYLAYFSSRIALFNNDSGEYGNLFDHCRETVEKIPGRCLISADNRLLDCQAYLTFSGVLNAGIEAFIAENRERYGTQRAKCIPELPDSLTAADLVKQCAESYGRPYNIGLGLDYDTVAPVLCNLRKVGCLSLAGGTAEAQSAYLLALIRQLNAAYPGRSKVWINDGFDRFLQPAAELPNVEQYTMNTTAAAEFITGLEQKAKARMSMLEFGDADTLDDAELLVLILNNSGVGDVMAANRTALTSFGNLITKYKGVGLCVISANTPNASFMSAEFYKKATENKQFIWFDNLPSLKIVTPPYTATKKYSKKIGVGDAYFFADTECTKLKTPID